MAMGVMPFFNPRRAFTFAFIGQTSDTTDTATNTFSGVSIGTASSDRVVIVAYKFDNAGGNTTLTSITIGGISATTVHATGTNMAAGVAYAVVPTGTTATIVITKAASGERASIAVYTLYGAQSLTASATDNPAGGADSARSASVNIPAGGCVVVSATSGGASMTWTGATEDYDALVEGGTVHSGASKTSATAITPETITGTNCRAIAAVAFR